MEIFYGSHKYRTPAVPLLPKHTTKRYLHLHTLCLPHRNVGSLIPIRMYTTVSGIVLYISILTWHWDLHVFPEGTWQHRSDHWHRQGAVEC